MKYVPQQVTTYKVNPILTKPNKITKLNFQQFHSSFTEASNDSQFNVGQLKQVLSNLFVSMSKREFDVSQDFDFRGVSSISDNSLDVQELSIFSVAKVVQQPIQLGICQCNNYEDILIYYLDGYLGVAIKSLQSDYPSDFLKISQELVSFVTFYEDFRKKMASCIVIYFDFGFSQQWTINVFQTHYFKQFHQLLSSENSRPGNFQYVPEDNKQLFHSVENSVVIPNSLVNQLIYLVIQGVEGQLLGSPHPEIQLVQKAFSMLASFGQESLVMFYQLLRIKLSSHVQQLLQGYYAQLFSPDQNSSDTPVVLKQQFCQARTFDEFLLELDKRLAQTAKFIGYCFQKKSGFQLNCKLDENCSFCSVFILISEAQLLVDSDMVEILYNGIAKPLLDGLFGEQYKQLFLKQYQDNPLSLLQSLQKFQQFTSIADSLSNSEVSYKDQLQQLIVQIQDQYIEYLCSKEISFLQEKLNQFLAMLLQKNQQWLNIQQFCNQQETTDIVIQFCCLLVIYIRFSEMKELLSIKIDAYSNKIIRNLFIKFNAQFDQKFKFNQFIEVSIYLINLYQEFAIAKIVKYPLQDSFEQPIFEQQQTIFFKLWCIYGEKLLDYLIQLISIHQDQMAVIQRLFLSFFKRALLFGSVSQQQELILIKQLENYFNKQVIEQQFICVDSLFADQQIVLNFHSFSETLDLLGWNQKLSLVSNDLSFQLSETNEDHLNLIKLSIEKQLKTDSRIQLLQLNDLEVVRGIVKIQNQQVYFFIEKKFQAELISHLVSLENLPSVFIKYPTILSSIDDFTLQFETNSLNISHISQHKRFNHIFFQAWIVKMLKKQQNQEKKQANKKKVIEEAMELFNVDISLCESQIEALINQDVIEVDDGGNLAFVTD